MTATEPTVRVTRVIPGPPEAVFAAWTTPERFAAWFAPHGYEVTEIALDVRPGGAYRATVVGPAGDRHTTSGVYTELDPPHRLGMTWTYAGDHPDAQAEASHLAVEFTPLGDRSTEVRLTHSLLLTDRARANVAGGWQGCLDKLEALFAPEAAS